MSNQDPTAKMASGKTNKQTGAVPKIGIKGESVEKDKASFAFSWIAIVVRGIIGSCISIFVYTQANRIEDEDHMNQFLVLSEAHYEAVCDDLKIFENELKSFAYYIQLNKEQSTALLPSLLQERVYSLPFTDSLALVDDASSSSLSPEEEQAYFAAIKDKSPKAALIETSAQNTQSKKLVVFYPAGVEKRPSLTVKGVIDINTLILANLIDSKSKAMNIFIYEREDKTTDLISFLNSEEKKQIVPSPALSQLKLNQYRQDFSLNYMGIQFELIYNATSEFTIHTWQPTIAASIGVVITTFIVVTAWILLEIEKRQFSNILHVEHAIDMEGTKDQLETAKHRLMAQEQLASLGGLTAGIAHEIKNPLNFINNFSTLSLELLETLEEFTKKTGDAISEEEKEELNEAMETLKENIHTIHEQGTKADNTIQRMLAHSRGQPGDWSEQDIHNILEEYINFSYHGMRAKNVNFKVQIKKEFDPTIKIVTLVVNDISRVFLNLLNNAMQAVDEKRRKCEREGVEYSPTVTIATKNIGNFVRIRIRDNGLGIKEENKSKIFTPFFTTKPTGVGTGLGLSLSYNIVVREHGGSLTFDSQENEYCEFILTIPKKQKLEQKAAKV